MRTVWGVALSLLLAPGALLADEFAPPAAAPEALIAGFPPDADVRRILAERVGALSAGSETIGIVVGMIGPQGRRVVSHGDLDRLRHRSMDGNTVFEIGSVTKVFTALLLADLVHSGEVALMDPVAKYRPSGFRVPGRDGRSITLVDLATHTSGLPFMPDWPSGADATAHSDADINRFLSGYQLPHGVGVQWQYSNLGYWLLSDALAFREGTNYESLLRKRILEPLQLVDTRFSLSPAMQDRLAIGHDAASQPSPAFSSIPQYSLMAAAGGLYSTVDDLLTLLSVAMHYEGSPLAAAFALSVDTRRSKSPSDGTQALGWNLSGKDRETLVFHDGGTFGYASCIVWSPARRMGVVVLSNQVTTVSDIARHLLQPDLPLEHPTPVRHVEVGLDAAVLDAYSGQYAAAGEGRFTVARAGDYLTIEAPADWGLPKLRIRPESEVSFFASELPLKVVFQRNGSGVVSGILVTPPRGQKVVAAQRVRLN